MLEVLEAYNPRPATLFRIAIEEIEAWLLDDRNAVKAAYLRAKIAVLDRYEQDGICDTWEVLAAALHRGGSAQIKKDGWLAAGNANGLGASLPFWIWIGTGRQASGRFGTECGG